MAARAKNAQLVEKMSGFRSDVGRRKNTGADGSEDGGACCWP